MSLVILVQVDATEGTFIQTSCSLSWEMEAHHCSIHLLVCADEPENFIGDVGAGMLCEAFKHMPNLKKLNLTGDNVERSGMCAWFHTFNLMLARPCSLDSKTLQPLASEIEVFACHQT